MSQSFDGTFSTAVQHGAKQITLPLKGTGGNGYATKVSRVYLAAPASSYAPIVGQRTAYTALLTYSDAFANAVWAATNATGTSNVATDPDGTYTAGKVAESNANGTHLVTHAMTCAAGATAFGVYAKAGERAYFRMRIQNGTDGNIGIAVFSLSGLGTVVSGSGAIKKLLNGWYWCSITATTTVTNSNCILDLTSDGSTFSYTGTTGSGVYFWRATAYLASAIGPPIATTSTTRAVSSLPVDADDPGAFLIDEQEPDFGSLELGVARWARTYANIPAATSIATSYQISRPALSGTFPQAFGNFRLFQPDTTIPYYDVYAYQSVGSDSGAPSFYPTGGTYTLSFAAATTGALNYNDAAATVQTALNALTPISNRGNVTVGGSYNSAGGLTITFTAYAQITITSSLTGGTIVTSASLINGGYTQNITAGIQGTKLTISANISSLTFSGGTPTFTSDYSDGGSLPSIANLSRCSIYGNGGYNFITAGTWTLTVGAYTTAAMAYNADAATIQAELDAVASGQFIVQAWEGGGYGPGGFYDFGYLSGSWFSIYFVGSAATGGTYTLTVGANTTAAINYNASASTVQTALNLLTSVQNRGNCTVAGALVTGFTISFANAVITADATSLTPAGCSATPSITDGSIGKAQKVTFASSTSTRELYVASHGITVGDSLYLKSGSTYYSIVTNFSVPTANTIRLNISASDAWASISTISECGKRLRASYSPGTATIRALLTTEYYLPGFTAGVATANDIPIPVQQSDTTALLLAIFASSGTINVQVGQLTPYLNSEILSLSTTTVLASDI